MSAHTPGPWRADPSCNGLAIESAAHGNVGIVNLARASVADARLIAAAPDLLEACQTVLAGFDRGIAVDANTVNGLVAARLRSAVAKAEGRS